MTAVVRIARIALVGGRSDTLRIALTAFATALGTLAALAAATVMSIGYRSGGTQTTYSNALLNEPGLRPGVAATLVLLWVPVLFLAGQCARVGSPARDRRLAALRMAGATPGETACLVAGETGLASLIGALIAVTVYFAGRVALDNPDRYGRRPLPTDVLPPSWVFVFLLIAVPIFGALFAVVALRRVRLTPFGVTRRKQPRPPRLFPAFLLTFSVGGLVASGAVAKALPDGSTGWRLFVVATAALTITTGAGFAIGAASLSAFVGRLVASRATSASALVAARRLLADPWSSSRAAGALLVSVFVAAGVLGVRVCILAEIGAQNLANARAAALGGPGPSGTPSPVDPFYARAFDLVNLAGRAAVVIAAFAVLVATAEQIVERRRSFAALTAGGTPRVVLAKSVLVQVALPLIPGVVLATVAGFVGARAMLGWTASASAISGGTCAASPSLSASDAAPWCLDPGHTVIAHEVVVHLAPGMPWANLSLLAGGAIAGTLLLAMLSLMLLRRSCDIAELRAA